MTPNTITCAKNTFRLFKFKHSFPLSQRNKMMLLSTETEYYNKLSVLGNKEISRKPLNCLVSKTSC